MARERPLGLEEMRAIEGVGERKLGRRKAVALSSSVSDPISQGATS